MIEAQRRRSARAGALVLVLLAALVAGPGAAQETAGEAAGPCRQDPRYRQLDFWLGEWRVVDAQGVEVGINRIEALQGGCLIEERWSSARGGTGQSMNYFDPAAGKWRQNWVDAGGGVVRYEGEVVGGAMRFTGENIRPDGSVAAARVVLEPLPDGRLHHRIEHSRDGGATWSTYFDAFYVRAGAEERMAAMEAAPPDAAPPPPAVSVAEAAPPPAAEAPAAVAPPEAPAPAPEAPAPEPGPAAEVPKVASKVDESSAVRAVSTVRADEEIPSEEKPQLQMASPMVLEIPLGPIDAIPEGFAWSTDEVAAYLCNQTTLKKVTAARTERRGQVRLELGFILYSQRYLHDADLEVELLSAGELVGRESLTGFKLGRGIPAQGQGDGLRKEVNFTLEPERFRGLFADGRRPTLRLTLAVP